MFMFYWRTYDIKHMIKYNLRNSSWTHIDCVYNPLLATIEKCYMTFGDKSMTSHKARHKLTIPHFKKMFNVVIYVIWQLYEFLDYNKSESNV